LTPGRPSTERGERRGLLSDYATPRVCAQPFNHVSHYRLFSRSHSLFLFAGEMKNLNFKRSLFLNFHYSLVSYDDLNNGRIENFHHHHHKTKINQKSLLIVSIQGKWLVFLFNFCGPVLFLIITRLRNRRPTGACTPRS
jgi:hypothetical protein